MQRTLRARAEGSDRQRVVAIRHSIADRSGARRWKKREGGVEPDSNGQVAVGVAERSGVNVASILHGACKLLETADQFRERRTFDETEAAEIERKLGRVH